MKKLLHKYRVNILLIAGFTAFALWFALKDDFKSVIRMVFSTDFRILLLVVATGLMIYVVAGYVLYRLAKVQPGGDHYTLRDGFENALVGGFFHGITPGASGGQISQIYIFRKQGLSGNVAFGLLTIEFITYEVAILIFEGFLILAKMGKFIHEGIFAITIIGYVINFLLVILLIVCSNSWKAYNWFAQKGVAVIAALHLTKDKEKTMAGLNQRIEDFAGAMKTLRSNKRLMIEVELAQLFRFLFYFGLPLVCCWALGIPVPENDYLAVLALTSFVTACNMFFPMPGATGGTESLFILMFSGYFGRTEASSIMFLWRLGSYYVIMVAGAAMFLWLQGRYMKADAAKQTEEAETEL